jgi:hypothetical protein
MKPSFPLLLLSSLLSPALVMADAPPPPAAAAAIDEADVKGLERFVGLVEKGKKEEAADVLRFPIARASPLPPVRNKQDFLASYDHFFDAKTIASLGGLMQKKDAIWSSWRGTSLGGALWADGGKIMAINLTTAKQEKAAAEALKLEKRNTHSSVDKYVRVEFACDTPSHRVRVQRLVGGNLRYVSWRPGEELSAVPEQVIEKGEAESQGTGGGVIYRFRDGKTLFQVTETGVCGEDCNSYLEIIQGKKTKLKEACKESL